MRNPVNSTDSHNNLQREYYESNLGKRAMQPSRGAYVLRHIERMLAELEPPPGSEILEIGAGLGKFSLPLIERGFRMTCVDLSPVMLERLRIPSLPAASASTRIHDCWGSVSGR